MRLKSGLAGLALSFAACAAVHAEISDGVVKVGVLNDISGIFQDTNGMGSVEAARMAADDFAGGGKNIKVEIVFADHQNKADVGSSIVRRWLDLDHVDAVVDVPNSSVGLDQRAHSQFARNVPRLEHRLGRSYRQGVFAEHRAMGERHVGGWPCDVSRDDETRRRQLV